MPGAEDNSLETPVTSGTIQVGCGGGTETKPSRRRLAQLLGSSEAPGDARAHTLFHLLTGEVDRGADWAEKAIEQRHQSVMFYLRFAVCKKLRASHSWPKIAEMLNLPVGGLISAVVAKYCSSNRLLVSFDRFALHRP
jgi:hypothetical protein